MKETLRSYFKDITDDQVYKLLKLEALYSDWNKKINVISRKDIENFNIHHLLHSLSIASVIQFKKGTEILDAGTGGGFPGIPLSILFPDASFTLVDSIRKKTLVIDSVIESLDLKNVTSSWSRVENIDKKFDFIISRAVTSFPTFVAWTKHLAKPINRNSLKNGILYLKGGDLDKELEDYIDQITIYGLSNYFKESFFVEKKIVYLPL